MRFHEVVQGVYFDDLDAFGILHNARYLVLFERTVGSFWKHLGWGGLLDAQRNPDQFHLVRANAMSYERPVTGVGEVRARVWVQRVGTSSLEFGFRLLPLDEDVAYATGTRVIVRVDPKTMKPAPWSPAFRQRLIDAGMIAGDAAAG
jgi:acyl-CoA thioester hydrolase